MFASQLVLFASVISFMVDFSKPYPYQIAGMRP